MIDIHCHVLPFVDYDGPRTLDDSSEMLERARKDGVGLIVATPHVVTTDPPSRFDEMKDALLLLAEKARTSAGGVELRLGAEIYAGPNLYDFVMANPELSGRAGRYVLVEFPMHEVPSYGQPQLVALAASGITAVLAHPERNLRVVRDVDVLGPLASAGVLFQVNSGSLLGDFGREVRRTANALVASGLCHMVASDAHNSGSRSFSMTEARSAVVKVAGEGTAKTIFESNPGRLLGLDTK